MDVSTSSAPSPEELAAYRAGRLPLERFEAIDAWLAAQSPEDQAQLLADEDGSTVVMSAEALADTAPHAAFTPDGVGPQRYRIDGRLGSGGMGVVELAFDKVLGRDVALKRCRARRVDESVASHAARLRAFRREAAITAQLEHPAIVPVHDVGISLLGEPAFVMKRLDGEPLSRLIERMRTKEQRLDLAQIVELMLRVAEAVAYAHRRGVVHRDLKPDNVIVGSLGAVHVIDWGLAGVGDGGERRLAAMPLPIPTNDENGSTVGTYRLGTPQWMAPEQYHGVPADPRMDVFALGGLLMVLLTGQPPRPQRATGPAVDLKPLETRSLPRGLVAVARRCLQIAPTDRYADGAAVADELRSWLSAGITNAEQAGWFVRLRAHLRRSPQLVAACFGVVLAGGILLGGIAVQHTHQRALTIREAQAIVSDTDLSDEDAVSEARTQIDFLLRDHPQLREVRDIRSRLRAVEDAFKAQQEFENNRALLASMAKRFRVSGPWVSEIPDLHKALAQVGYPIDPTGVDDPLNHAIRLHEDRLAIDVMGILTQLCYAYILDGKETPLRQSIPRLIAAAGPTQQWRAMGEVLAKVTVFEHDLVFCRCPAADAVLTDSVTTDLVLAGYGPEPRLVRAAWERWHENTAAFWARIMTARNCLKRGEWRLAERHALVALGSEPDSLWPHLVLAYVGLADHDWEMLLREANAGRIENHDHLELVVLAAIGHARNGRLGQAQAIIDQRDCAASLRYHLASTSGHPFNIAVRALVEAGIKIPNVKPKLGPLVRR